MLKTVTIGACLLVVIGASGCSSQDDVDIGGDRTASLGASLSDYAGSWEGYVEALTFPDGTDRVRLNLDSAGQGTLTLGNDAPPLPAPDADEPPPGLTLMGTMLVGSAVLTGYPYTVSDATIHTKRIQLATLSPVEYEQWCELQTPVLYEHSDQPEYHCIPGAGYRKEPPDGSKCYIFFDDGSEVEAPCGKLECVSQCACSATGCSATGGPVFHLDVAFENGGENLVGTMVGYDRSTVRFEKN
jgi:hypothetical protein